MCAALNFIITPSNGSTVGEGGVGVSPGRTSLKLITYSFSELFVMWTARCS